MSITAAKRAIRHGLGLMAPTVWRLRPTPSLIILMYHRVLPAGHPDRLVEQPGMYVSPETLQMHLRALKQHFEIVNLADWVDRSRSGRLLPTRACAVTFDDGWRDNYDYGFPVLEREQVRATIFLVADLIGRNYDFWPNRLARLMLEHKDRPAALPQRLVDRLASSGLHVGAIKSPMERDFVETAIVACKSSSDEAMVRLLDDIDMGRGAATRHRSLLSLSEITEMKKSGLLTFGSHSRRHTRLLEGLAPRLLQEEVVESRAILQRLLGESVDLFCYPDGDCSEEAVASARSAYSAAVTTRRGWNHPDSDPHLLRRIGVHEDITADRSAFLARVAGLA